MTNLVGPVSDIAPEDLWSDERNLQPERELAGIITR